jgi:Mg-chelatase subunit ChlD
VKGGGRTALGPALALAMGIISMHDQGSRIIMVTDSMPNFGILTAGDADYIYKKIGGCLKENGATLSILKWSGD